MSGKILERTLHPAEWLRSVGPRKAEEFVRRVQEMVAEAPYYLPSRRGRMLRAEDTQRPTAPGRWFTRNEADLVEALASLIIPSDEERPGIAEVEVLGPSPIRVIEAWISESPRKKRLYSRGLVSFRNIAQRRFGRPPQELSREDQREILEYLAQRDRDGRKKSGTLGKAAKIARRVGWVFDGSLDAIELFSVLTDDSKAVFYTSRVSWIWLGYDGPPMPLGYPDLDKPRPPTAKPAVASLEETAQLLQEPGSTHLGPNTHAQDHVDVVVIGSGAGGAVVAKELAEAGVSVVILEAGRRFDPHADFQTHRDDFELSAAGPFDPDDPRRDIYTLGGSRNFKYNRAKGVGGSTLTYVAMSPRLHEADFRTRTEDGVGQDWPIRYEDLEPFYTRVEYELGVSGADGENRNPFDPPRSQPYPNPPHPFNLGSMAVKRAADGLGWHMVREPVAIPSRDWGGRPACIGAGTCQLGCAIAAKSSMDVTYIPKALATGRVELRTDSMAFRILLGKDGRAKGVVYFDKLGDERRINARVVVIAGNAVETPRLLLMSSSGQFPDGLANSSGLVGKHFMEHLGVFAFGLLPEPTDPWRGTPTGGMIQDFYETSKDNGFARGWTILLSSFRHWPLSVARGIPGWGAEHKNRVEERFGNALCVASIGEQLPDPRNQVLLDSAEKDSYGLPAPRLVHSPRQNDRAMISGISSSLNTLLEATGATEIWGNQYQPGGSSHYLGTCRMGSNPGMSVVDAFGRAHDVPNLFIADGSVLVTGGAVNPALTISALATRTAEEIARSLVQREV